MLKRDNIIKLTPDELRKLQLVQLEMLIELDRICKKFNIKYSLDGGTLLGAVRHNGFIPWDDDIDIIMLREEYEKFYEACKKELDKTRFFLQESRTDKFYHNGFSRLRRENSVFSRWGHEHMNYHQGIFIDIFVLDNVPEGRINRKIHKFYCFILRKMLWAKSAKKIYPNVFMRSWYFLLSLIPRDFTFYLLNSMIKRSNKKDSELVSHFTHPYPNNESCKYGIPKGFLTEFIELEFEGRKFMAVKEYDKYLTMLYNDYMKLPPEDKRRGHMPPITEFSVPSEFNYKEERKIET